MSKCLAAIALMVLFAAVSLTACTGLAQTAAAPPPQIPAITVMLTGSTISASQMTFRPGVRYHFIVTNYGPLPRQFWLMPQAMAQMMRRMPVAQWRQLLLFTTSEIGRGMRSVFDLTFTMSMAQQW